MNIDALENLLAKGTDNALLRFGLGKAYLDAGQPDTATTHFAQCVAIDPGYSAAWKLYGKAMLAQGDSEQARHIWQQGIQAAQTKGDKQAEKEMQVFIRKLDKKT